MISRRSQKSDVRCQMSEARLSVICPLFSVLCFLPLEWGTTHGDGVYALYMGTGLWVAAECCIAERHPCRDYDFRRVTWIQKYTKHK